MPEIKPPVKCSNRELFLMLQSVQSSVDNVAKLNTSDHAEIKAKQDHTNGDVKKLKIWKAYLTGAWAVVSIILISILIPLSINYLNTKNSIKQQVDDDLSVYLEKQ